MLDKFHPLPDGLSFTNQLDEFDGSVNTGLGDSGVKDELLSVDDSTNDNPDDFTIPEDRLTEVVGNAYKTLSTKADKDKRAGWKAKLSEVLDSNGNMIYVKHDYRDQYK